jgi:O-antigen chain-terminating methyltransferase
MSNLFWSALDSSLKKLAENPTFYSVLKKLASLVIYYRGPKVTERIVEYPFACESLKDVPKDAKILDVGCTPSTLPLELAAFGYKVWGIDLLEYPSTHPNFKFVMEKIEKSPFPDEFFDVVLCISTLEHIGLYGFLYPATEISADKKAVREMARVVKTGGKVVVTVPYGVPYTAANYRVYDSKRLKEVIGDLQIEIFKTFMYTDEKWLPCTEEEASKIHSFPGTLAVACLQLRK